MQESYLFLRRRSSVSFEETRLYEHARKWLVIRPRENRVVTDPCLIEKKIKKQLQMAENHRSLQQHQPNTAFRYQKADETILFTKAIHPTSENLAISIGTCQAKGAKPTQEDRLVTSYFTIRTLEGLTHQLLLTGVFDGHKGSKAAAYMQGYLPLTLSQQLSFFLEKLENNRTLSCRVIWNALKLSCVKLSDELREINIQAGTTASFSLLIDGEDLWLANLGDSRSFIASSEKTIQLSEDMLAKFNFPLHLTEEEFTRAESRFKQREINTSNSFEKSIWKRGGFVRNTRVNGSLQPARDIGKSDCQAGISSRPKITKISLSNSFWQEDACFLVHASDGLWIEAKTNQVAEAVCQDKSKDPQKIAKNLVYSAQLADDFDNISVLVLKIDLCALRTLKKRTSPYEYFP